ncbi:hypothetical protein KJ761_00060 [Patescibacteria group bacterium]|nr:hypothetical protein [Patescibacteria group bacterium]
MKRTKILIFGLVFALFLAPGMVFSGNVANVTQVGIGSLATIDQVGANNLSNVFQYGNTLKGDVDQIGNLNHGYIFQGTSGAPVSTPALVGYITGAKIYQEGDRNYARTSWFTGAIGSRIYQVGNDNYGTQDLSSTEHYVAGRYAVEINQVGNSNRGVQTTSFLYGSYGIGNMLIDQDGNSNTGTQVSIGGKASVMNILQRGNTNTSYQYQDGMVDVGIADIFGDGNTTFQSQISSVWGAATSYNSAIIHIVGNGNNASQTQYGVRNSADISVTGSGNVGTQVQNGDYNVALLTQNGLNNNSTQSQTGNGNASTVLQTGNNLISVVTQIH